MASDEKILSYNVELSKLDNSIVYQTYTTNSTVAARKLALRLEHDKHVVGKVAMFYNTEAHHWVISARTRIAKAQLVRAPGGIAVMNMSE